MPDFSGESPNLKAVACVLAALTAPAAVAAEDLEARLQSLEALVVELKAELAEQKRADAAQSVAIEDLSATRDAVIADKVAADGFMVGDTHLSFGGFVDLDTHFTQLADGQIASTSIARDFYIPSVTPIGGESTTTTDITAQATRFYFDAKRMHGDTKIAGHIELDFLGSFQGNERVSSSFSPRLRRAYLDVGNWRLGQDWSTFQNTSSIPESASFLILSDGMVFERQPIIRYTHGNWQFAAENGDTTVTNAAGGRIEADSNRIPDLIARYNHKGDFGNVSVAALVRELRLENQVMDETTTGFALSVSGRLNVGAHDDIRFNVMAGEGMGRYVGLNAINGAAMDLDGDLEAIESVGGLISWRHLFPNGYRLNVGYSGLFADQPDYVVDTAIDSVQSVFAALLWNPSPKVTVGVEFMNGTRELVNGDDGDIRRFTFSTKYAF